jgi:hypothetical protein
LRIHLREGVLTSSEAQAPQEQRLMESQKTLVSKTQRFVQMFCAYQQKLDRLLRGWAWLLVTMLSR